MKTRGSCLEPEQFSSTNSNELGNSSKQGFFGGERGYPRKLYGMATVCYHAFYLPLLYVTFLADFFQEEDLNLENVYYSEMKDAGFFDADWE